MYGTPLAPGAEANLAALITSWTSLQLGSLMSNIVVGGPELIRTLLWPSSWSLSESLNVLWRKVLASSVEHLRWSLHLLSSSLQVKLKVLAMKDVCPLALSFACLRCHSCFYHVNGNWNINNFLSIFFVTMLAKCSCW